MTKENRWSLGVTPKDDGLHPSDAPGWWQWWYFDADFDNGYWLSGTFDFGSPRPPANPDARFIEIALYDPEGNKRMTRKRYPLEKCFASTERLDVKIGPNFCKGDLDKTHWYFKEVDKQGREQGMDLIFERVVEPYCPKVKVDGTTDWVIVQPRNKVSGTITWDGRTMPVKGEGYHDLNWADVPLLGHQGKEDLLWTRIFMNEWVLHLCGGSLCRSAGHEPKADIRVWHKDKVVAVSDKGAGMGSDFSCEGTDLDYPLTFQMSFNDPGIVEGEINFKTKKVIEYMDLHSRFQPFQKWYAEIYEGKPAYFRFTLEYDAALTIQGKSVKGTGLCWCEYHKWA